MITIYLTCFILILGLLFWYFSIENYEDFVIVMAPVFEKNDILTSSPGTNLKIVGYKTKGEYIVKLLG